MKMLYNDMKSEHISSKDSNIPALQELALKLDPYKDKIREKWSQLYLTTFGRNSFFPQERVEQIHQDFVDNLISFLKNNEHNKYSLYLKEKGRMFSSLGVPFEEIMISIHLLEESYREFLFKCYQDHTKLCSILVIVDEFQHSSFVSLASSYFDSFKRKLEASSNIILEENRKLKNDLSKMSKTFFSYTKKELASMELLISGIDKHLKNKLTQATKIQHVCDNLIGISDLRTLTHISQEVFSNIIPSSRESLFFMLDHENMKFIFSKEDKTKREQDARFYTQIDTKNLPENFLENLFQIKKPFLYEDLNCAPAFFRKIFSEYDRHNILTIIPALDEKENILAFIAVVSGTSTEFIDVGFLEKVSKKVSDAFLSAIFVDDLKQQAHFLAHLNMLNMILEDTFSLNMIMKKAVQCIMGFLKVERCSIMLIDQYTSQLYTYVAIGQDTEGYGRTRIKMGEGLAGKAVVDMKPITSYNVKTDRTFKIYGNAEDEKIKAILCAPITASGRVLGVVNATTFDVSRRFTAAEIRGLGLLAMRLAVAIIKKKQ